MSGPFMETTSKVDLDLNLVTTEFYDNTFIK